MKSPFEKLHLKFCKQTIGVHRNAHNLAARAELGKYPLEMNILISVLRYYLRLKTYTKGTLLHDCLEVQSHLFYAGKPTLMEYVGHVLKEIGFSLPDTANHAKNWIFCYL